MPPSRKSKSLSTRVTPSSKLGVEVLSLLLFALAAFSLCALLTYRSTDPSFFHLTAIPAQNACGKVGAYLADLLLQMLGVGAFLVPAALVYLSAGVHSRESWMRVLGIFLGMAIALLALTIFVSLQWSRWAYAGVGLPTGGALGLWVASHLVDHLNSVGAAIVSLLVFLLAIVVSTPVSVVNVVAVVGKTVGLAVWRVGRVMGSYLLFLLGLALVRIARATGNGAQKLMVAAVASAKAQVEGWAELREEKRKALEHRQAIEVESEVVESELQIPVGENLEFVLDEEGERESESAYAAAGVDDPSFSSDEIDISALADQPSISTAAVEAAAARAAASAGRAPVKKTQPNFWKRGQWKLPKIEFLSRPPKIEAAVDKARLLENSQILKQKLADFGIPGDITAVRPGPVITLYEFRPGPGIKVSKIAALADDLSMALSAESVRILAPLPGKSVVGIEIPSDERETVYMREFLSDGEFYSDRHSIPVVMGKDIGGQPMLADLARMPHLLVAGETGSGKSVFMNSLICSILYRFTPDELRMILIDPKFIEFRGYEDIPHLMLPVVDDPKEASTALKWAVREMERRYRILAMMGVRNLAAYNSKVEEMGEATVKDVLFAEDNGQERLSKLSGGDWHQSFETDEKGEPAVGKLPYILVVIDELADLMMIAKKDVEISIARIAQKARAAGIHLVIATQRPSTDVVTGLIKANLPSRVSFRLTSYIDSKTIIDRAGAEKLLGLGDMLFVAPGAPQPMRLQGAYMGDDEIEKISGYLRSQGKPVYREEILIDDEEDAANGGLGAEEEGDALFEEAVDLVKRSGHASASFLQRHLKVGYNRAARMIETMEMKGIVGPAEGARPREVLIR